MNIDLNNGEILQGILKQSGYSIARLAKQLNMSRSALYDKFKEKKLPREFIIAVGNIVGYDTLACLPGIMPVTKKELIRARIVLNRKYIALLEDHAQLLEAMISALVYKVTSKRQWKDMFERYGFDFTLPKGK